MRRRGGIGAKPAPLPPSRTCRTSRPSAAVRATKTPMKLASDEPVTNNPLAPSGKSNILRAHSTIWRSTSTGA
jgi:hypothetical protein